MKTMYKIIFLIVTLVPILSGCSQFEEMNHNPNQQTYGKATPSKLMQDIIYSGHWTIFYRSWRINSQLMQYSMYVNGQELTANYDIRATESTSTWQNYYRWASNAAHMYEMAIKNEDENLQAVALTLKVYIAEVITALFGEVPYSEAFQWENGISHPKYDTQEEVYTQMINELNKANTLYNLSGQMDYPERDLLYQGDFSKWQKFTNSLRLRLLMRVSKCEMAEMDPIFEIQNMLDNPSIYPLFASNADAAILKYTGVNPFYNGFGPSTATDPMSQNNTLGATLVDLLNASSDPRLPYYAKPKNGEYIGMASGMNNDYIAEMRDIACTYASSLSTDTSPSTLMNYAEVLFILTEAQFRGLVTTGTSTEDLYNQAVTASIRQWTGNEAFEPGAFLQSPSSAAYNGTLERIMEQKYIAMFLVGYEAWCDYRRTGLPEMPIGPAMVNKDEFGNVVLPTRLRYPLITQTTNYENWKAAVARLDTQADDMLSKVWFAKGNKY